MKEITPPEGYLKNEKVYEITKDGEQFPAEYNSADQRVDEDVVKGDISIIKGMTNGEAGIIKPESKAEFQVYLEKQNKYQCYCGSHF